MNFFNKFLGFNIKEWAPRKDLLIGLIICSAVVNVLSIFFPLSLLQIYDRIIPNKSYDTLLVLFVSISIIMLLEMVLRMLRTQVAAWIDAKLSYRVSLEATKHLLLSKLSEYNKRGAGTYMEHLNNLDILKDFYGGQLIITMMDVPFLIIFLYLISHIGGIIIFVPIAMIIAISYAIYVNTKMAKQYYINQGKVNKHMADFLVEVLSGMVTVKSLAMEEQILRKYELIQNNRTKEGIQAIYKQAEINRVIAFYAQINTVLVAAVGVMLIMDGNLTMGGLSACSLLAGKSVQPVAKIMSIWNRFQLLWVASNEYKKIKNIELEVATSSPLPIKKDMPLIGYLCLDNISLKYEKNDKFLLKEISMNIPFGDTVAITGANDGGKSSLMSIIAGLTIPTKGDVTLNGESIFTMDLQEYRRKIGFISEQSNLFDGTIIENLTMFRDGEYIIKAKIIAEQLGVQHEIDLMNHGYNTKIGHSSLDNLSRGLKQGLIIVRSLLDDPGIIVFDEANAYMDVASDQKLIKYFLSIKNSRTIILVSSRPSLLKIANRVYEINNGHIYLRSG
jgi:ATP-binding cassette subfamily C protein LapB